MNPRNAAIIAFAITSVMLVALGLMFGVSSIEPGLLFGETVGRHAFTAAGVVYVLAWFFSDASRGE
jgi:hypothetical protein